MPPRACEVPARDTRVPGAAGVGYTCGMCGRFLLLTSGADVAEFFDLAAPPELFPRYNVAPTQPVLTVRAAGPCREAALLRWGLIAQWAKDARQAPINARAETAADKPTFMSGSRSAAASNRTASGPGTSGRGPSPDCGSDGKDPMARSSPGPS